MGRIAVVGMGPAGAAWLSDGALAVIGGCEVLRFRTRVHPAADALIQRFGEIESYDHLYDTLDTFAEVYDAIAADVRTLATAHGRVGYIVPGSPLVLEQSARLLRDDPDGHEVVLHPAPSFLDLAYAALGVDPVDDAVRLIDGHRFGELVPGQPGPFLVAHCHSNDVLSDIKLSFEPPEGTEVTLLHHLGLDDERVETIDFYDMDRTLEADHLTSLYLPRMAVSVDAAMAELVAVIDRLRRDCPWDAAQTHASLKRYLVEEAAEVLGAIDDLDVETGDGYEHLQDELGDLLFQIVLHARLAAEPGWFVFEDVVVGAVDKLVRRHPHVFGDADVGDIDEQRRVWEEIKASERAGEAQRIDHGLPNELSSILLAAKVLSRAAGTTDGGGAPVGVEEIRRNMSDGLERFRADDVDAEVLGQVLFGLVELARTAHVDAEDALRSAARSYALGHPPT